MKGGNVGEKPLGMNPGPQMEFNPNPHHRDGFCHDLRPNQGTQTVPTEGEMHGRV
jgi:hypothetical protein